MLPTWAPHIAWFRSAEHNARLENCQAIHDEACVFDDERINNEELNYLKANLVSLRETALNFAKVTARLTCKFYRSEYTDAKGLRLKWGLV